MHSSDLLRVPTLKGGASPLFMLLLFSLFLGCVEGVCPPPLLRLGPFVQEGHRQQVPVGGHAGCQHLGDGWDCCGWDHPGPDQPDRASLPAHLQSRTAHGGAQSLANRPPPGTVVEITKGMKLKKILESISTGHVTMEQATLAFASFIDDEDDEAAKKALQATYKLLVSTKDLKGFSSQGAAPL